MDPYEHYLVAGRHEGRLPLPPPPQPKPTPAPAPTPTRTAPDFDADFYVSRYPDVAASGVDPYEHFTQHGRAEGRLGCIPRFAFEPGGKGFDPNRETVLVVSHEASRTGAPVLSLNIVEKLQQRYNVVSLLMGPGQMVEAFRQESALVCGPLQLHGHTWKATMLVEQLHRQYPLKYAIANSIESRVVLEGLARQGIPSVALIHEFAAYTRPRHAFHEALFWASETVFSTAITHENAVGEIPELRSQPANILPQGRSHLVTEARSPEAVAREEARVRDTLRPGGADDDKVVVIGAGFVQQRKGIDLFIECAARVLATEAGKRCRFVWIGKGYDPEHDIGYSVYLADQLRRSGVERDVIMMNETSSIEVAYDNADILLISSRLDPLPNVAIDAMAHGLPVVCFDRTTGFADVFAQAGLGGELVAGYLDTADMADKVIALANAPQRRRELGERMRRLVDERFDMQRYVDAIDGLAARAAARMAAEDGWVREIVATGLMRRDFFPRPFERDAPAEDLVRFLYLRGWESGLARRKLFPGFHPGIWQERHGLAQPGLDPLVDWLRAGRPPGPWTYEVIADTDPVGILPAGARVALHLHVFYADLLPEMLERLGHNAVRPDLFISVPNARVGEDIRAALAGYAGRVADVQVVPNRGRDIGPFLTAFGPALLDGYDFVGHLHTKKTADLQDASVGRNWYVFLLENLLGGQAAMADAILARMAADPSIGMVFPDDPNIVGWGSNQPHVADLAARLGVTSFPEHFHFPVGTMFWARVESLRPLFELGLDWEQYPPEPLPYDGSVLHGLERLFPLVAESRGGRCVLTNVRGQSR
jgi:glycosyltransferase involved in cell wall biosynthesis